jgi:hypothetical protein
VGDSGSMWFHAGTDWRQSGKRPDLLWCSRVGTGRGEHRSMKHFYISHDKRCGEGTEGIGDALSWTDKFVFTAWR